ncbi:hypothetical protein [Enterococcus pallens]|uniref:Uncharacterized protein n=1 Tax=Enterococcus pallens ATCC BAA-351 TaxID=1158607 RepID=R2RSK1_9ENTE|nr:hypothetical protein [Enterococcus pallens]EOH86335.1 hypothetical protein UAU_05257 [Enterococcus pallens ATCC BAA-351]EOU09444.1 hypothetical protein I588_05177 [Enterococcus pallens ATCC BAA-351]
MKLITLIFSGASLVVDTVGWGFAQLIKVLLQGISTFCGWGVGKIQSLPENIQIPVVITLVVIFLGIFLAGLWGFPHIVISAFIVVPLIIFMLKLFIGWIVLFSLIYMMYLCIKRWCIRLWSYVTPNDI